MLDSDDDSDLYVPCSHKWEADIAKSTKPQ